MQFFTSHSHTPMSSTKRLMTWAVAFIVFIGLIFAYSGTAHAGLISYIFGSNVSAQTSAETNREARRANSQNLALLQAASNFDPNPEKASGVSPIVGNVLVADMVLSEGAADTTSTQISTYVVREGDTISGIAKMFKVSVNTILWANDIGRASALRPGQTLVILPVTGISYTVKKGDTIKSIALKYKADVDEIFQYNDLDANATLVTGQTVIIPDAELRVSVPTKVVFKNNPAHDTNGPDYSGYYAQPVSTYFCSQNLHGYNGVDMAGPRGTPIYAAAAGTVLVSASSGWNGGYGNLIIISHDNGTQTVYGHLSKNTVSVGQRVGQGQSIGLMGATGKATGSHLHFEIRGARNPFVTGCPRS